MCRHGPGGSSKISITLSERLARTCLRFCLASCTEKANISAKKSKCKIEVRGDLHGWSRSLPHKKSPVQDHRASSQSAASLRFSRSVRPKMALLNFFGFWNTQGWKLFSSNQWKFRILWSWFRICTSYRWGSGKPHDLARSSVDEGCIVSNRVFTTPSTQRGHVPSLFSFFALRAFLQTVRVYLAAIKKMKSLHVTAARNHALKRCGGDWGAETPYRHETSCMKPWYGKKIAWISMHEHAAWRWFLGSKIDKPFNARLLGQSLEVIHHQPHLSLYRLFWQVGCQLSKNLKQTIVVHWLRRGNHCHGYEHPRMCTNCFFAKLVASEIKLRTQNYSCVTPSYKKPLQIKISCQTCQTRFF